MYTIWSKPGCIFCDRAKALLIEKGLSYVEHMLDVGQPKQDGQALTSLSEFKNKNPTVKSVPYITLGGTVIGGFTELAKSLA